MLSDSQHETHILFGKCVHRVIALPRQDGGRGRQQEYHPGNACDRPDESMPSRRHEPYLSRIVGIKYWSNAWSKSYRGAKPQSRRAALSLTSSGHESTMA